MYAVLGIDLEFVFSPNLNVLIHTRWAVKLLWAAVLGKIKLDWDTCVFERQVRGLIFLMIGVGDEDGGESVKTNEPIRLGVDDRFTVL